MKYEQIIHTLPRLLTARQAEDYLATPTMLALLIDEHGLRPVEQRKGMTVYDRTDIDLTLEKMKRAKRKVA